MFFASSYELRCHWQIDQDPDIESYDSQVFALQCEGMSQDRCIDLIVKYKDGRVLVIEVKPESRLGEEAVQRQIGDSKAFADHYGWLHKVYTEADTGLGGYGQINAWALKTIKELGLSEKDFEGIRNEKNREKARRFYSSKISQDTVALWCDFCGHAHKPLRLTYDRNIKRNGRYICEKEGGFIAGSKPKKKKVNPYAEQGMKQCAKCTRILSLDSFGDDKSRSDGKASRCRECRSE
jgi:hypothetical protein